MLSFSYILVSLTFNLESLDYFCFVFLFDDTVPSSSWQDPELLRDIEAATGLNLTVKKGKGKQVNKKGKGKGKGKKGAKKYPGLTDLTLKTNTSRKRLEKRVFNK